MTDISFVRSIIDNQIKNYQNGYTEGLFSLEETNLVVDALESTKLAIQEFIKETNKLVEKRKK